MITNLQKKVNNYINNDLLSIDNLPTDVIEEKDRVKGIVARLFSRRFRKYVISNQVKDNVTAKVKNIVERNLPITFIPSFGGYKHWWSPTYPEIDWAEVFNMKFILEYLAPIYNSHSNDVEIEYESEEVILAELNNVPQSGLDKYTETFRALAAYFTKKLNGKTRIELTLARDLYDVNELHKIIEKTYEDHEKNFDSLDPEEKERRIKKAESNFLKKGTIDYSGYSEFEMRAVYKRSRVLNETFLDADFELRPNYFEGESSIPLLFSFGLGPGGEAWLHIGSCKSSMADFWAGTGILEYWEEDDKFVPRILTRTQYEAIEDKLITVDVESDINGITNNFNQIKVYMGKM